eukprot:2451219-Amphidinium_carterae.1
MPRAAAQAEVAERHACALDNPAMFRRTSTPAVVHYCMVHLFQTESRANTHVMLQSSLSWPELEKRHCDARENLAQDHCAPAL